MKWQLLSALGWKCNSCPSRWCRVFRKQTNAQQWSLLHGPYYSNHQKHSSPKISTVQSPADWLLNMVNNYWWGSKWILSNLRTFYFRHMTFNESQHSLIQRRVWISSYYMQSLFFYFLLPPPSCFGASSQNDAARTVASSICDIVVLFWFSEYKEIWRMIRHF